MDGYGAGGIEGEVISGGVLKFRGMKWKDGIPVAPPVPWPPIHDPHPELPTAKDGEPPVLTGEREFLTMFYCCYDIVCDFTLADKVIASHVNIKSAWTVEYEAPGADPKSNGHEIPQVTSAGLQSALNTHMGAKDDVDWDNIEDIKVS